MGIGLFREKLQICYIQSSADGYGGYLDAGVVNLLEGFCKARQKSSTRNTTGETTNWDIEYQFDLRFDPSVVIGKANFIIYANNYFTIQSIERINERTFYWKILATKNETQIGDTGLNPSIVPGTLFNYTYVADGTEQSIYLRDSGGNIVSGATIIGVWKSTNLKIITSGSPTGNQVLNQDGLLTFPDFLGDGETVTIIWLKQ